MLASDLNNYSYQFYLNLRLILTTGFIHQTSNIARFIFHFNTIYWDRASRSAMFFFSPELSGLKIVYCVNRPGYDVFNHIRKIWIRIIDRIQGTLCLSPQYLLSFNEQIYGIWYEPILYSNPQIIFTVYRKSHHLNSWFLADSYNITYFFSC